MPSSAFTGILLQIGKTVGLYGLALVFFRLMGKRCLGDMEPLDFVVVIAIAEIFGAPLADPELRLIPPVIAVTTLALLQMGLARLSISSPTLQRIFEGRPIAVIRGGRVLADNLKRCRISLPELTERLRERGFLDAADVELATFETDGMLSVIPKRAASPVTPRFLGREASTTLLVRGKPDAAALGEAGMTVVELEEVVRGLGLKVDEVEEMWKDPGGRLHVTLSLEHGPGKPESGRKKGDGAAAKKK